MTASVLSVDGRIGQQERRITCEEHGHRYTGPFE